MARARLLDPGPSIRSDLVELRWQAIERSGADPALASIFAAGSLAIAGPRHRAVTVFTPGAVHAAFLRARHLPALKQAAARQLGLAEADFTLRIEPLPRAGPVAPADAALREAWPSTADLVRQPGPVADHLGSVAVLRSRLWRPLSRGPVDAADVLAHTDPCRHLLATVCRHLGMRDRAALIAVLDDRFRLAPSRPVDRQTLYETLHALPGVPPGVRRPTFQARPPGTAVTASAALDLIAEHFGVSADELRGRGRSRPMDFARVHALSLLRRVTHLSQVQIAAQFGGRHHTALVYAAREAAAMARADPALRTELAGLARTCDRAGLEAWAGRLAAVLNREAA